MLQTMIARKAGQREPISPFDVAYSDYEEARWIDVSEMATNFTKRPRGRSPGQSSRSNRHQPASPTRVPRQSRYKGPESDHRHDHLNERPPTSSRRADKQHRRRCSISPPPHRRSASPPLRPLVLAERYPPPPQLPQHPAPPPEYYPPPAKRHQRSEHQGVGTYYPPSSLRVRLTPPHPSRDQLPSQRQPSQPRALSPINPNHYRHPTPIRIEDDEVEANPYGTVNGLPPSLYTTPVPPSGFPHVTGLN